MSLNLVPLPIRLFCDIAVKTIGLDLNANAAPFFVRGDDIEIDIGIGQSGLLLTPLNVAGGAGSWASVTAQLFQSENDTNAPMMACTVLAAAINGTLTQSQWTNQGAPYNHAAFIFPAAQTAINLLGAPQQPYWLRIFATSGDGTAKEVTLLEGVITVKDGPISAVSSIPNQGYKVVVVNGLNQIAFLCSDGNYRIMQPTVIGGVCSTSWSDTTY